MSLWKKIGLGLAAAVALFIVALVVAVLVPGGWKFSLVVLGVPAVAGWVWFQMIQEHHPSSRREETPPPGFRWDERTERWRHPPARRPGEGGGR